MTEKTRAQRAFDKRMGGIDPFNPTMHLAKGGGNTSGMGQWQADRDARQKAALENELVQLIDRIRQIQQELGK